MFSEYYFYMAAFIEDKKVRESFNVLNDAFPTIYRIDRIRRMKVLDVNYKVIYKDRFEEGEFRKRIQFKLHWCLTLSSLDHGSTRNEDFLIYEFKFISFRRFCEQIENVLFYSQNYVRVTS